MAAAKGWTAREVDRGTAKAWIPRYHYSGSIGHTGARFYGAFDGDDEMMCVVGVGPATNAYGMTRRFGLDAWPGNREITRVAAHPDAPRNTASRSVALVGREMRRLGWHWLYSYADLGQGHHGGIYQALNAVYVGVNVGGKPPPDFEILTDGVWTPIASRTVGRRCGTGRSGAIARMAELGHTIRLVNMEKPGKHTYILPISTPATRRAIHSQLARHAKPYPSRLGVGPRFSQATDPLPDEGSVVPCPLPDGLAIGHADAHAVRLFQPVAQAGSKCSVDVDHDDLPEGRTFRPHRCQRQGFLTCSPRRLPAGKAP